MVCAQTAPVSLQGVHAPPDPPEPAPPDAPVPLELLELLVVPPEPLVVPPVSCGSFDPQATRAPNAKTGSQMRMPHHTQPHRAAGLLDVAPVVLPALGSWRQRRALLT
ncbi:Hypothetical protein A7982_09268 [Minicystis rosea]|nr:Hypothetical protein A7982_09268 [Minicystis rosea]